MSKVIALVSAVAVGGVVWFVAPFVSRDMAQVWFIGAGDWRNVVVHGRDVIAGAAGVLVFIGGLLRRAV